MVDRIVERIVKVKIINRRMISGRYFRFMGIIPFCIINIEGYIRPGIIAPRCSSNRKLTEDAYQKLEQLMGVRLDTAALGPKVRIYISDFVSVSHVWKGYDHPKDPKGIIFLNQRPYLGALKGTNATYIHEMTHLFSWRFQSHTLREGLADYMALKILPGTGVGPSPEGYDWSTPIPSEVIEYLGTTRPPPQWVTIDPVKRRAYYFASYRLVKYLIDTKGLETFKKLYKSDSPETEVRNLYGLTREEAIRAAGM